MAARRPTLAKVAALAGVSVSQASDALRGGGRVSAATRDRVRAAAKQLGYQTQSVAKVLREGVADFIVVVADRATTHARDGSMHPFWAKFLTTFTVTVRDYGYAVILDFGSSSDDLRRLPAQAVLTLTSDASRVQSLRGGGFGQVVALSPDADPVEVAGPEANAVIVQHDYRAIGREAAAYLADRGANQVLVLRRPGRHWYLAEVVAGLESAAPDHDLLVHAVSPELADPAPSLRTLLTPDVDAVLDFTGLAPMLEAVIAEQGRHVQPRAGADALVVLSQSEGTGPGTDPCVHYLSFEGSEVGEIVAEHFVAVLYGRQLDPPTLPYRFIEAPGLQ